jgi:hypothetical protein
MGSRVERIMPAYGTARRSTATTFLKSASGEGVGTDSQGRFQVLGVHEHAHGFVLPVIESEQRTDADILDASGHGAVMGFGVPFVVALGTALVDRQVGGLVVGLLEQDVGADASVLQLHIVGHRGRGDIDVGAADITVLELQAVDGLDAFQDVVDGAVDRILAEFQGQPLVPEAFQHPHLLGQFRLGELAPGHLVIAVVAAIGATVDTVVGEV